MAKSNLIAHASLVITL